MKRMKAAGTVIAALGVCLLAPLAGSAAGPPDVVCPQDTHTFTGTARDLIVPAGGGCAITDARITRDLVLQDFAGADVLGTSVGHDVTFGQEAGAGITQTTVGHDIVAAGTDSGADLLQTTVGHDVLALGGESGFDISQTTVGHDVRLLGVGGGTHMELTTIAHDFFASAPQTVQTGMNGPNSPGGPVKVGNDFAIEGSPPPDFKFVFDGICNLTTGRDFRVTDRAVTLGIGIGNICASNGEPANTIGRDLVVTGNSALSGFFGPSAIQVGGNHVGRDLVFSDNTALPGGGRDVSGNVVGRDATCAANNPAATAGTPNVAARANTCG